MLLASWTRCALSSSCQITGSCPTTACTRCDASAAAMSAGGICTQVTSWSGVHPLAPHHDREEQPVGAGRRAHARVGDADRPAVQVLDALDRRAALHQQAGAAALQPGGELGVEAAHQPRQPGQRRRHRRLGAARAQLVERLLAGRGARQHRDVQVVAGEHAQALRHDQHRVVRRMRRGEGHPAEAAVRPGGLVAVRVADLIAGDERRRGGEPDPQAGAGAEQGAAARRGLPGRRRLPGLRLLHRQAFSKVGISPQPPRTRPRPVPAEAAMGFTGRRGLRYRVRRRSRIAQR